MRALIAILLTLTLCAPVSAQPHIETAAHSVVALDIRVPGGNSYCAGFVYKPGYVITAEHCVDNAVFVRVFFRNSENDTAKIVSRNKALDVAVLKLATKTGVPVRLNRSKLEAGDEVYAIGHPRKYGWTVTRGVVSRTDAPPGSYSSEWGIASDLIQSDALIFGGSSGGVLLTADGRLVGMVVGGGAIMFVSYAIPIATVADEADKAL